MFANHVCRDAALPGTLAVLAGLALGVNAWGGFHWDYSDVSRGIIAAAPLCFVCEHYSRRCSASDRPNGLAAPYHIVAVLQLCLLTNAEVAVSHRSSPKSPVWLALQLVIS
jgi:hypothetical protein